MVKCYSVFGRKTANDSLRAPFCDTTFGHIDAHVTCNIVSHDTNRTARARLGRKPRHMSYRNDVLVLAINAQLVQ
jgi:hypothetical protein